MRHSLPRIADLDAVLFDAGGTLVELDYAFIAARAGERGAFLDIAALRLGEARTRRVLDAHARAQGRVADGDAVRLPRYFAGLLDAAGVAAEHLAPIVAEIEAAHALDNLWRVEIDGALPTLRALRERGLATAVVSNADGRVEKILTNLGLVSHLSLIVDSHLEGVEKPDPEIFRRALARLGISAARAIYVGDIYSIDAVGARAAGLEPVLLDPTGSYPDVDCATIDRLDRLLSG